MSEFTLTRGVEGDCLVLDGTRIAGPKPWGGGRVVATFTTKETYVPERTCHMIDNGAEFCCSECDRRHDYDDEPQFCMGCGAKVVNEGTHLRSWDAPCPDGIHSCSECEWVPNCPKCARR